MRAALSTGAALLLLVTPGCLWLGEHPAAATKDVAVANGLAWACFDVSEGLHRVTAQNAKFDYFPVTVWFNGGAACDDTASERACEQEMTVYSTASASQIPVNLQILRAGELCVGTAYPQIGDDNDVDGEVVTYGVARISAVDAPYVCGIDDAAPCACDDPLPFICPDP